MKPILLIIFGLILTAFQSANNVAISDSELKVMAIEDMMKTLPQSFVNIEDFMVSHTVTEDGTSHAVGILNVTTGTGACRSFLTVTNSDQCQVEGQCRVEHIYVDCTQVDGYLENISLITN